MKAQKNRTETMITAFAAACRVKGLKVTRQRLEIYCELLESHDHPSAEQLHKRLTAHLPNMSLDTVYRAMASFEQHGLVSRIQTAGSLARFEAVTISHHHLICSICNKVEDFSWSVFDSVELPTPVVEWGTVTSRNVVIYGICSRCARR